MAEMDLGKVMLTDEEFVEKISALTGGLRFGKDTDGKWGYIVPEGESEGADTVIPFSIGGGVEGIEYLTGRTSMFASAAEFTLNITVERKYKAIVAVQILYTATNATSMANSITLATNSFLRNMNSSTGVIRTVTAADVNLEGYSEGSTYTFKSKLYTSYASGTAVQMVFGIF